MNSSVLQIPGHRVLTGGWASCLLGAWLVLPWLTVILWGIAGQNPIKAMARHAMSRLRPKLNRMFFSLHNHESAAMLRSYSAELNGSQLVWLDVPPERLARPRVLVVVEDSSLPEGESSGKNYQLADLAGRLQWHGDALQAQRVQRDAW